eukprot:3261561-Pyramimonas_sp.AAC.1
MFWHVLEARSIASPKKYACELNEVISLSLRDNVVHGPNRPQELRQSRPSRDKRIPENIAPTTFHQLE